MPYDQRLHHRKSIRYPGYDYASPGVYFITLCAADRQCLFGEIRDEQMILNAAGTSMDFWWRQLAVHYPDVELDDFIVMPNHVHGIVQLTAPVGDDDRRAGPPLPRIVQWFKAMSTNAYIHGVRNDGWPAFRERIWQRNYYERIIRSDKELDAIREYIRENPRNWLKDSEYAP